MTRKEASRMTYNHKVVKGYCCYQALGLSPAWDLIEIGVNHGVYGWNWTLYLDPKNMIFYCSGYRNYPIFRKEVSASDVRDLYFHSVRESGDDTQLHN